MIRAYRLCLARHAVEAFSGKGAEAWGGRWNPPGTRAVYCADSRALAALEILVHAQSLSGSPDLVIFEVDLPESLRVHVPRSLPAQWKAEPVGPASQAVGAKWLAESAAAVLKVPSAVIPKEFNFVLNPAHADFRKVRVGGPERFVLDGRLTGRRG